eukprot:gene31916-40440_t
MCAVACVVRALFVHPYGGAVHGYAVAALPQAAAAAVAAGAGACGASWWGAGAQRGWAACAAAA